MGGAARIELNSALMLGGLTPTASTLCLVKGQFPKLKVIAMVRPRGAGFCYTEEEFLVMEKECQCLLEHGADGLWLFKGRWVFGPGQEPEDGGDN